MGNTWQIVVKYVLPAKKKTWNRLWMVNATKLSEFCTKNEPWKGGHVEKLAPKVKKAEIKKSYLGYCDH